MTKKTYIEIAENIRVNLHPENNANVRRFVNNLCDTLKQDNKLFNKDKFYSAIYD